MNSYFVQLTTQMLKFYVNQQLFNGIILYIKLPTNNFPAHSLEVVTADRTSSSTHIVRWHHASVGGHHGPAWSNGERWSLARWSHPWLWRLLLFGCATAATGHHWSILCSIALSLGHLLLSRCSSATFPPASDIWNRHDAQTWYLKCKYDSASTTHGWYSIGDTVMIQRKYNTGLDMAISSGTSIKNSCQHQISWHWHHNEYSTVCSPYDCSKCLACYYYADMSTVHSNTMSPSLRHISTSTTHYICIKSTYSVVLNLALAHIVILCFLPLSFAGGTFRRHHQKLVGEILLERMVIVDLQILL